MDRPSRRPAAATSETPPISSSKVLRHGAYLCLSVSPAARRKAAVATISDLAARLGFVNEFSVTSGHPDQAIAFLRRVDATPGDIADDDLLRALAIVHVAAGAASPVQTFCDGASRLLAGIAEPRRLTGVVRPKNYTSHAMHEFAYAHEVTQQPARLMPNAYLVPLRKTAAWWAKDWMERHTYFLPRYDAKERMVHQGHALAASAGIRCLMRRTYKHPTLPGPPGAYEFINYFECADSDVATFHEVCRALRDRARNPEWAFVLEGPTWHGQRVETWPQLFG